MDNNDELWQAAREMAESWTEAHKLERNRTAYSYIPFPETHDQLCAEADDTQYLAHARCQAPWQFPTHRGVRTVTLRSLTYKENDYRGYAAGFDRILYAAAHHALTNEKEKLT